MQNTQNTGDCKKYNSDSTPKKAFAGKSTLHNPCNGSASCEHSTRYTQLYTKIVKLEIFNKKLKCTSKKCKAKTLIHPEVMGPVALGSYIIVV